MTKTALLVIDFQNGVVEGQRPCHEVPRVLERIQTLLAAARSADVPVIYVQDDSVGPEGSPEWQIHAAIAPKPGEPVVRKLACDAFHGTNLHQVLQERGVNHLVIAGAQTQYCVESACRKASTLGYNVTLVADAHTTCDTPVLPASQIIAHVNWTLDGLDNLENHIEVHPTAEIAFA